VFALVHIRHVHTIFATRINQMLAFICDKQSYPR
jgi:hypothetical protein